MSRDGRARWLSLAADPGAIMGLFLIVAQLQRNRRLKRTRMRHELAMGIVGLLQDALLTGRQCNAG